MTTKEESSVIGESEVNQVPLKPKKLKIHKGWVLFWFLVLGLVWLFSLPTHCPLHMTTYVGLGYSYASRLTQPLTEYYREHGQWPVGAALDSLNENAEQVSEQDVKEYFTAASDEYELLKKCIKRILVLPDGLIFVEYNKEFLNGWITIRAKDIKQEAGELSITWQCYSKPGEFRRVVPQNCQ